MTSLVRAELLKVRTVRLFWTVIGSALGITALGLSMQMVNAGRAGTPSSGTAQCAVNVLSAGALAAFVALVLGIVMMTTEYRHATIATTLLVTPPRGRVVVAKIVAALVLGLSLAVLATALSAAVGVVAGALTVAAANAAVVRTVAGAALTIPLYAAVGVGFGSLVHNQTVAVASALVWLLVGETLVGSLGLRALERWTPGGATRAIAQDPTLAGALPPWAGVALLAAYAFVFAAMGGRRIARRDVA
jgi:hypothetical protein